MEKKQEVKFPNLVAEMARNGDTQVDVAKVLKIGKATINRKLRGATEFTMSEIETLCKHYKKEYSELFK